jgi:hypothetical protein
MSIEWENTLFRSFEELQWSLLFNALGIRWTNLTPLQNISEDLQVKPSFWIPHLAYQLNLEDGWGFWGEVTDSLMYGATLKRTIELVKHTRHNAFIFIGAPKHGAYSITKVSGVHFDEPKVWTHGKFAWFPDENFIRIRASNWSSWPMVDGDGISLAKAFYKVARITQEIKE